MKCLECNQWKLCIHLYFLWKLGLGPTSTLLGGIAIALLEVARFMIMRLIASIIIQGVPIRFSSLRAATFYFITAIVKSEVPFSKSGDITIIIPLQTNWVRVGVVTSNNGKMAKDMASPKQQQLLRQLRCVLRVAKQSRVFMLRETKVHLHVLRSKLSVTNVLHCIFRFFIRWNKN